MSCFWHSEPDSDDGIHRSVGGRLHTANPVLQVRLYQQYKILVQVTCNLLAVIFLMCMHFPTILYAYLPCSVLWLATIILASSETTNRNNCSLT